MRVNLIFWRQTMYFVNDHVIKNVVVIGAGGTGSRMMPQLIQFLKTVPIFEQIEYPNVYVFDDDIVEEKNLTRQLFIKPDVGHNKAAVLANRYEKAYNYPIIDVKIKFQDMFEQNNEVREELLSAYKKEILIRGGNPNESGVSSQDRTDLRFAFSQGYTVYIISVDSMKDRFEIFNVISLISRQFNYIIIDAGNENTFGQVSNFHLKALTEPAYEEPRKVLNLYNRCLERAIPESYTAIKDTKVDAIPFPWQLYLGRQESELSCADLDQTLAVNSLMASGIMVSFQNIALMKPLKVVTTYYNLNGIHTQDLLTLDSFKAMSDQEVDSLSSSGLRGETESIPYNFCEQVNIADTVDRQSDLFNLKTTLATLFTKFTSTRVRETSVDNLKLKPIFTLLESIYYEKYIHNGRGFIDFDDTAKYFWDVLDIHNMVPKRILDMEETEIQFTLSQEQIVLLASRKTGQSQSEILNRLQELLNSVAHDGSSLSTLNIYFRIRIVDYLNIVAYYLINGKDYYDMNTRYVFSTGLVKGAGIPLLSPEVTEEIGGTERLVRRRGETPNDLSVVNPRYQLLDGDHSGFLPINRNLTQNLVNKIEELFKYVGKYIDKQIGFENFCSYGLIVPSRIYTNRYVDVQNFRDAQTSIALESEEYSDLKTYIKNALEYFFSNIGEGNTSELLDTWREETQEAYGDNSEITNEPQLAPDGTFICRVPFYIPYGEITAIRSNLDSIMIGRELDRELTMDADPQVSPITERIGEWLRENDSFTTLMEQDYRILSVTVHTWITYLQVILQMRVPQMAEDDLDEDNNPEDYIRTQVYFGLLGDHNLTPVSRDNLLQRIMRNIQNNPSYRRHINLGYEVREVNLTGTTPNLRLRINMGSDQTQVPQEILIISPERETEEVAHSDEANDPEEVQTFFGEERHFTIPNEVPHGAEAVDEDENTQG